MAMALKNLPFWPLNPVQWPKKLPQKATCLVLTHSIFPGKPLSDSSGRAPHWYRSCLGLRGSGCPFLVVSWSLGFCLGWVYHGGLRSYFGCILQWFWDLFGWVLQWFGVLLCVYLGFVFVLFSLDAWLSSVVSYFPLLGHLEKRAVAASRSPGSKRYGSSSPAVSPRTHFMTRPQKNTVLKIKKTKKNCLTGKKLLKFPFDCWCFQVDHAMRPSHPRKNLLNVASAPSCAQSLDSGTRLTPIGWRVHLSKAKPPSRKETPGCTRLVRLL